MTGLRLAQEATAGVLALAALATLLVAIAIWRGQWWLWTLAMLAGAAALAVAVTLSGGTRMSTAPAGPIPGAVARGPVPTTAGALARAGASPRARTAVDPVDPSRIGYDGATGPRPDTPEREHPANRGS